MSYPEKFHLALKYATEGPPLPNLSDADRILLDALQQQALSGECSKPRPGMWDSAEDKAKYEAWKKLGTMSRAEAMHLYVQAIEVFDDQWLTWRGLQQELAANPADHDNHKAEGGTDLPPLLRALRDLRATLPQLPPEHVVNVRDECHAILKALPPL